MDFEQRHMDVLQNIEAAITQVHHKHPELYDAQVDSALGWVLRVYSAEARGKAAPASLPGLPGEVAGQVLQACEWRLGRAPLASGTGPVEIGSPKTRDEIVACVKRIRRSVQYWQKEGGQQGYLTFIEGFLP